MSQERGQSLFEIVPPKRPESHYDVAILGGGLAGLTLSIQLKRQRPETSIVVLERRDGPAPDAAFKVGESTVVAGSHYFQEVVGMKRHLQERQLRKCGLRFWLSGDGNQDLIGRFEIGGPTYPPHDDYQLDRGRFENALAAEARALGVDVLQSCRVEDVTFGPEEHTIAFQLMDEAGSVRAGWVVDAAGRASLLKRKLGLAQDVQHHINSAWLRLDGGLDIETWASAADGLAFMFQPGIRQFSTNHLLGEGYWVWLIPLATGPISIGVCADPRFHPYDEINDLDSLMKWMSKHEPQLASSIEPRLADVQDFLRVRDFAFGVERVFSPDRWCLVGEAGAFADPFYSPGSDMIGYGNSLAADLIHRDLNREDIAERLEYFNDLYLRTFANVLSRTEDHYATFGNQQVSLAKINFDNVVLHTGTVIVFLAGKLTDLEFMRSVDEDIERHYQLNIRTQQLFRDWHKLENRHTNRRGRAGPHKLLVESNLETVQDYSDEGALKAALKKHVRWAEALAVVIFHKAASGLPEPPDPERSINPYAVSLDPNAWEPDGLYSEPGWTLADAAETCEGFEQQVWFDEAAV